jgi:hypothetical protein
MGLQSSPRSDCGFSVSTLIRAQEDCHIDARLGRKGAPVVARGRRQRRSLSR